MLKDYKELEVWKKAYDLVLDIYRITESYPKTETYGLTSQLRRCAVSVPSNIAEGYRRQYRKEYSQFLSVALGSVAEIETQILMSKDLKFISEAEFNMIWPKIQEVSKMLSGLMSSLKGFSKKIKAVAVFILAVTLPSTLYPTPLFASGAGTTAANFLKVSMSARAMGMAGAFSALADDSGSVFSNPAGLAVFDAQELGLGFTNYIQDTKIGNLSYSTKISENKFGLGISFLNVDGIEKRTNDEEGIVPYSGTFDANDLAVSIAYAKKDGFPGLMDNLDVGFAIKFINSKIDDSSAFAAAFDAGAIYRANEKTNFSFVLQNVGSSMKFEDDSDPLPINLKVGALYKPQPKINLVAELTQYFIDEKFYPALGAEYWFRDAFALRGGYKFGYDTSNLGSTVGLSLGFGLKVSGIGLDYAYLPFGELGNIHRFGFWIQF